MPAPDEILNAVAELSEKSGHTFKVTDIPVQGTDLYVVYAEEHPFAERYTVASGILGFRVPSTLPHACPEDSFFVLPSDIKLKEPDNVRRSVEIHRASPTGDFFKGTELDGKVPLVFSWHIWNKGIWNRNKHKLMDHYNHCVRRFEAPEHDG